MWYRTLRVCTGMEWIAFNHKPCNHLINDRPKRDVIRELYHRVTIDLSFLHVIAQDIGFVVVCRTHIILRPLPTTKLFYCHGARFTSLPPGNRYVASLGAHSSNLIWEGLIAPALFTVSCEKNYKLRNKRRSFSMHTTAAATAAATAHDTRFSALQLELLSARGNLLPLKQAIKPRCIGMVCFHSHKTRLEGCVVQSPRKVVGQLLGMQSWVGSYLLTRPRTNEWNNRDNRRYIKKQKLVVEISRKDMWPPSLNLKEQNAWVQGHLPMLFFCL